MRISFADYGVISETTIKSRMKRLDTYRAKVFERVSDFADNKPEFSLVYALHPEVADTLTVLKKEFKGIKHLLLIGIGGSSLGVEAVHQALGEEGVGLLMLDTIAPHEVANVLCTLTAYKKPSDFAVCVVSKSGATSETLVNAAVVLEALTKHFGVDVYSQVVYIGNAETDFIKEGKRKGVKTVAIPTVVGGRFSVGTLAGLVPLTLLNHNTDGFIQGFLAAHEEEIEVVVAEAATRLALYIEKGYQHYTFFAFEKRLTKLGFWYRQLQAESLGKSHTRSKKAFKKGFVPSVATAVELHSIGQLYLSGYPGLYTDFVTFDDAAVDYSIKKTSLAKRFARFTAGEVATALYGGVVGAYNSEKLPHRSTIFEEDLAYEPGLFMAMRMRETMYTAELLDLNAFDQPNVESYKTNTTKILGL